MEYLAALYALVGALSNRIIRGSGLVPGGKIINAILFGLMFGIGLTLPYWQWLALAVAMYLGAMPGWGRYIGAMGGWESKELKEFAPIDFLIQGAKNNMQLWGFLGLTLRGGLWGGLIAIAALSLWPLVAGLLMGVIYFLTISLSRAINNNDAEVWRGKGWELGEVAFGAVLWGLTYYGFIAT